MSGPFLVDPLTQEAQRRAADPRVSAWVSANAGAGKTKVLIDRVVRLLLDGSNPARILCLTFTKAAAANMSIRVFQRLGRWVTLDDTQLSAELAGLSGDTPSAETLGHARRLFARAVETPGGLKIETLHALCERLLHMFPFEANVPARFEVLDDDRAATIFRQQTDRVLADAILDCVPALRMALDLAGPETSGDGLREAIRLAMDERAFFGDAGHALKAGLTKLSRAFGLAPGETSATIEQRILSTGLVNEAAVIGSLRTGRPTDERLADGLAAARVAGNPIEAVEIYRSIFFTDKDEPRKALGTKAVPESARNRLLEEQERLAGLFDALKAARSHARTSALFTLAAEIHRRVEAEKTRLGALDFDDLIHKTLDLLRRVEAPWILYKLDRGIDHVLVDEAQDTNPQQWEILRRLTEEFTVGETARQALRTRFAVGDPKQSIYGFQGAEPREFEETRRTWSKAAGDVGLSFEDVTLQLSFRSSSGVLRAVDAVFALPEHYRGLSFSDGAVGTVHGSARGEAPGAVELWSIEAPRPEPDPDAWTVPVDLPEPNAPPVLVARRVARAVRAWTTTGDACGRIWRPGDVLVLVRKRSAAFTEVIRQLKANGVPVAGQDRLEVAGHIAVLDLVAIGRTALLPADDLTLATALKTPLVGLTDDDLVRIASRRPDEENLQDALARYAEGGDEAAIRGQARLAEWIALAAIHGPFGFYAALLGPRGGRKALVSRLGGEAGDAIDVFLAAAQSFEGGSEAPSLSAFLQPYAMQPLRGESGHTVKRDMESGRDEVRVMTVHGAKGLEAPVVVLIDGCEPLGRSDSPLLSLDPALPPVWVGGRGQDSAVTSAARSTLQEQSREEHNRLLYVAMTRAADHLVVAPYRGATPESPASWCEMIRIGLERHLGPGEAIETEHGPITLWREGSFDDLPPPKPREHTPRSLSLPDWATRAAPVECELTPPLSPSSAVGAADRRPDPGRRQSAAEARRRGKLIHALLEHLPRIAPGRRAIAASHFVSARAASLSQAAREALVADCLRLLAEPDLAPLFGQQGRAEVALAGSITRAGREQPVLGRVDRLAIDGSRVLVCDFKTGRPPAHDTPLPSGESEQIALYALLLQEIYPGREIVPILVWTSGPVVRRLGPEDVAAAVMRIENVAT